MFLKFKVLCMYFITAGIACSASNQYFYTSVGVCASLGPGSVLTSSKPGTFNSGNMQRASNGSVIPAAPLYNASFDLVPSNNNQSSKNAMREDMGKFIPISGLKAGGQDPTVIEFEQISENKNTVFTFGFSNEPDTFYTVNIAPQGSNLQYTMHLQNERGGTGNARTTIGTVNLEPDAQDPNTFNVSPNQIIEARDNGGNFSNYVITGYAYKLPSLKSAADPATPSTQIIDFSQGISEKNKTGLAYMFGVTSQYVMQSGMTVGLSINYGKTGSTSTTDYAAGSISGTSFSAADNIRFSTKDTGFVSEFLQLGYAYQRFNPYLIFGLAQHRAKMFCPDAYQNAGSSITKGYNTPVFGLGLNVAMTKNIYLNVQWQRHMGGVKSWGKIPTIIPQGRLAMGSPQSRMGNTMILFGVTCVTNFNGKR
jgi:opacity protein-like surface antigen